MTRGRLHLKLRQLAREHDESEAEGGELNLVSYLDIISNVVMFLLMTTTCATAVADINVGAETLRPPGPDPVLPVRSLDLTVQVSARGLTVASREGVMGQGGVAGRVPTLPLRAAAQDTEGLTRLLTAVKRAHPGETRLVINADPAIPYEVLVAVMDASRSDGERLLFPDVLLSAGVN
jgi:biopolymer transport protein ExbD